MKPFIYTLLSITAGILLAFAYQSCVKPGGPRLCNNVECLNGSYCLKGQCMCPAGYEGTNCATPAVDKFIGAWRVRQVVTGSDSFKVKGKDTTYTIQINRTTTPTTFFIDNFLGDPQFNSIVGIIDSTYKYSFCLDTARDLNMWYKNINIRFGSGGEFVSSPKSIWASVILRYINYNHNWQVDTLRMDMTPAP